MNTYMKILLLAVAISAISSYDLSKFDETRVFRKFQKFIETYGKNYTSIDEMDKRYQIFKNNYIWPDALQFKNITHSRRR